MDAEDHKIAGHCCVFAIRFPWRAFYFEPVPDMMGDQKPCASATQAKRDEWVAALRRYCTEGDSAAAAEKTGSAEGASFGSAKDEAKGASQPPSHVAAPGDASKAPSADGFFFAPPPAAADSSSAVKATAPEPCHSDAFYFVPPPPAPSSSDGKGGLPPAADGGNSAKPGESSMS